MRGPIFAVAILATELLSPTFAQRTCNELISVATADELRTLAGVFAQVFEFAGATTDPTDTAAAAEIFAAPVLFDVAVSKVCASCADSFPDAPPAPCQAGTYGADATYSALAFHPLDENGRVLNGELNGQMSLLSTRLRRFMAPTLIYPNSITELLGEIDNTFAGEENGLTVAMIDVFHSLMTASSGGIGMIFDPLGTGESEVGYDRSWGIRLPVQQGAAITWNAVQNYTSQVTNGCTTLQNRAFMFGYSLGAHDAMWASATLQEMGVEIVQGFMQAGPYDIESLFSFLYVQQTNDGVVIGPSAALFGSALMASYSNPDATYLANAASPEQYYIAESWRNESDISRNVPEWWFGEDRDLTELVGYIQPLDIVPTMVNEAYGDASVEAVLSGGRPCDDQFITEQTNLLCEAIRDNADVYPLLFNSEFPIQTCHSPNDDVVPSVTTEILPTDGLITPYEAPLPFMEPNSNHVNSNVECFAGITVWMGENPDFFEAIPIAESLDGQNCSATSMPTLSPSNPPSSGPTTAPVVGTPAPTTPSPTASPVTSSPGSAMPGEPSGTEAPVGGSGSSTTRVFSLVVSMGLVFLVAVIY